LITIRTTLKPGDLGYVAYLHGLIYDQESGYGIGFETYVLEGLAELGQQYDPQKDHIWICEDSERIVGFLAGVSRGESLQLRYFILLTEYRGKGIGNRLMDLFTGFLRERDYRHAFLWTTNEQHAAIALYTRYGFRLTEEKKSNAFGKALIERKYELLAPHP
jgi:peptidyl-dipeptidase Dcp